MNPISYSQVRQNLAKIMDQVYDDHEPVVITRKSDKNIIMLSFDDYQAIEETAYLLRSSANVRHLKKSIKQFSEGKYKKRKLIE